MRQRLFGIGESDVHACICSYLHFIFTFFSETFGHWVVLAAAVAAPAENFSSLDQQYLTALRGWKTMRKMASCKEVWLHGALVSSQTTVVYLLKTWLSSSNCQPWFASNEERVGVEGPHQGNFSSWRLLRLLSRPPYVPVVSGLSASISHLFVIYSHIILIRAFLQEFAFRNTTK